MVAFVFGTFPMFFGIRYVTSVLGEVFRNKFLKTAALLFVVLGALSVYGGSIALGVPVSISKITSAFNNGTENRTSIAYPLIKEGFQIATINVESNGYTPNVLILKPDTPQN